MTYDPEEAHRGIIDTLSRLSANSLREHLADGTLKQEELTEEQKQLLRDYPEKEKQK